jgi:hypothetical protein
MSITYRTYVEYDHEAGIWFTEASTIPGLGASDNEIDKVVSSLNELAPVLLKENVYRRSSPSIPKYDGPPVVEHEVVVLERDGHVQRRTPTKINVLTL